MDGTPTPLEFFDIVIPNASSTVTKIVAAVIRQTLGKRREWWVATNEGFVRRSGIGSTASFGTSVWDARTDGYIVLRELTPDEQNDYYFDGVRPFFALRLRFNGDPLDAPAHERPFLDEKLRRFILERDNRTCRYCGVPATQVDHIVPSAGGCDNSPDNLAAACGPCNRRKGARTPEQAGMILRPIPA